MIWKSIKQSCVYLLEVAIVLFILNSFFYYLEFKNLKFWENKSGDLKEIISFNVTLYAIYQFIIFVFFSLFDSSKQDSINAFKHGYNQMLVLIKYNEDQLLLDYYAKAVQEITEKKYMVDNDNLDSFLLFEKLLDAYFKGEVKSSKLEAYIETELVNLTHGNEIYNFKWRLSFLLRVLK